MYQQLENDPRPKTTKNVKQLVGMGSYYRKFIKGFSNLVAALNFLLRKGKKFVWTADCESAYKELLNNLLNHPILVFPDYKRPFRLITDASNEGLGRYYAR